MPRGYSLEGYLSGGANGLPVLTAALPLLKEEITGDLFVPQTEFRWSPNDLLPVTRVEGYFRELSPGDAGQRQAVHTGQVVAVADSAFVDLLERLAELDANIGAIAGSPLTIPRYWKKGPGGAHYAIATRDQCVVWSNQIFGRAKQHLVHCLFQQDDRTGARLAFEIIEGVPLAERGDVIVAEGLYYFTQRRFDEFDMLVLEAVNAGVCVSEDDLRDRVKREIDWQYEGRPRAESPGPSMGGGVSEHIRVDDEDSVVQEFFELYRYEDED